jgi:hypothetical protein
LRVVTGRAGHPWCHTSVVSAKGDPAICRGVVKASPGWRPRRSEHHHPQKRTVFHGALGFAVEAGLLDSNPADSVSWQVLERAEADDQPELHSFATGIRQYLAAVTAGLTLPYSSGSTEGNVNRIKAIKRQMYGRASLDLLRKRVIHHPP